MTKKAAIVCAITTILILSFPVSTVFSYDEWDAETLSVVNVRENSEINGRIISTLSKGHPVVVVGEQGNWYNVKVRLEGDQIYGWIYNEYLEKIAKTEQPPAKDIKPAELTTETSQKIANQAPDVKTAFAEQSTDLQPLPFKGKTTAVVNMRKAPEINAGIIMSVLSGQELSIIEEAGSWYKVYLETDTYSLSGWINKSFIKAEKQEEKPAKTMETPQKTEQLSANEGVSIQTNNPVVSADITQKQNSVSPLKEDAEQAENRIENSVLQKAEEKIPSEIKTIPEDDKVQKINEPEKTPPVIPPDMEAGTEKLKTSETKEKGIFEVFATVINLIFALFSCVALLCSIKALNTVKALTAMLNELKDEK